MLPKNDRIKVPSQRCQVLREECLCISLGGARSKPPVHTPASPSSRCELWVHLRPGSLDGAWQALALSGWAAQCPGRCVSGRE